MMVDQNLSAKSMRSILQAIGNTPLLKLEKIIPNKLVTLLVKCEFANPSGSVKDRIVDYIITDAEQKGLLKPGGTIVENTSGNTGAAIALLAAVKGYRAILTMPDKVSIEKQNTLRAYGAEIVVTPTTAAPDSPEHYVNVAKRIAAETPNSFRLDQYDNPKNPEAHYVTTAPEIWQQTQGKVDIFIASGSTGGTVSGIGRFLKEKNPAIKVMMPDPMGSIYYEYFKTGKIPQGGNCNYLVEGVGEDHIAKALDFSVLDEIIPFTDKDAFLMARRLSTEEGLLVGGSSGANVWAALKLAAELTEPATIVTILPDSGIKYLSKIYNDAWMKKHHLL